MRHLLPLAFNKNLPGQVRETGHQSCLLLRPFCLASARAQHVKDALLRHQPNSVEMPMPSKRTSYLKLPLPPVIPPQQPPQPQLHYPLSHQTRQVPVQGKRTDRQLEINKRMDKQITTVPLLSSFLCVCSVLHYTKDQRGINSCMSSKAKFFM